MFISNLRYFYLLLILYLKCSLKLLWIRLFWMVRSQICKVGRNAFRYCNSFIKRKQAELIPHLWWSKEKAMSFKIVFYKFVTSFKILTEAPTIIDSSYFVPKMKNILLQPFQSLKYWFFLIFSWYDI